MKKASNYKSGPSFTRMPDTIKVRARKSAGGKGWLISYDFHQATLTLA